MTKRKYIKNSKGVTMSVTTDTLGLEKPLLNENYNIDVHNRNMDKIDEDLKPIDDSYIFELFQHDGDTTNPRDYYTKVEADEKFASKEDLNSIDLSNLATKEEANNALNKANEALQAGSNVKQSLVDKLTSEGLNVSTNNTFEELIGNIALGKKWASGITQNNTDLISIQLLNSTAAYNTHMVYLPSLNFTPSLILGKAKLKNNPMTVISIMGKFGDETLVATSLPHNNNSTTVSGATLKYKTPLLLSKNSSAICIPYVNEVVDFYWYAFE